MALFHNWSVVNFAQIGVGRLGCRIVINRLGCHKTNGQPKNDFRIIVGLAVDDPPMDRRRIAGPLRHRLYLDAAIGRAQAQRGPVARSTWQASTRPATMGAALGDASRPLSRLIYRA
jgi:hypothetical protein